MEKYEIYLIIFPHIQIMYERFFISERFSLCAFLKIHLNTCSIDAYFNHLRETKLYFSSPRKAMREGGDIYTKSL